MIQAEYGIHTFSLKLQCKYSEIQNIIEQNECIRTGDGKLGLSSYYQMPQFKDIAYHAAVAMDKIVYLAQLCLYYFRGFR